MSLKTHDNTATATNHDAVDDDGLGGGDNSARVTSSMYWVYAPQTQTLPVAMYNYVREFADPSMAALSVMYIVGTAGLIAFANAFLGLGKVLNIEQSR